jgi:hypothetical protein
MTDLSKEEREKVFDKVRKLLALSKSPNEHEAALAAERAREILDKYQISLAEVDEKEFTEIVERAADTGYSSPKLWVHVLSMSTAKAFDCKVYRAGGVYMFCGLKSDTQVAEYIFTYLCRTVFDLMKQRMKKRRAAGIRGAGDVASYAYGAADAIGKKIEAYAASQRRRDRFEEFKTRTGKDLMVVKNGALEQYWKTKKFGQARPSRMRVGGDYWVGKQDGEKVNIYPGISGAANGGNGVRRLS